MKFRAGIYTATVYQLAVAVVLLWLLRPVFYLYNSSLTGTVSLSHLLSLMWHGLAFDLSVLGYANCLFVAMRFLPAPFVTRRGWLRATDCVYYITNSLVLLIEMGDIPFFRYAGSRLRWSALVDMFHDPNISGIVLSYFGQYWWAFLGAAGVLALMVWLYRRVTVTPSVSLGYLPRTALFVLAAGLTVWAIRGSLCGGKPLAIGDATWHIDRNPEINIVLNSPFCVLRSLKGANTVQEYALLTPDELAGARNSVRSGAAGAPNRKNIMVITLESGGQLFIDRLNIVPGDTARHLMPFLDSIAAKSLSVVHTIATGKRSSEGITSIFGGFANFEPLIYMLSPYNANTVDAPARLLRDEGYATRFYFGGNRGSYSIDQTASNMGFTDVIDRDKYGDDDDFDGTWGIFDHAMARYAALDITSLGQPFMAGWFTINAHAPFTVPDDWRTDPYRYPDPCIERSIEYTDRSLRRFFEHARTQPWYDNTIFIITADHGCRDLKGTRYDTPYVMYHIPFIVYTPDGSIEPRVIDDRVMSQIDISPTILGLVGYDKPYVSVGVDILDDTAEHYAANLSNNQYQVYGTRYVVQLDMSLRHVTAVYDIVADPFMTAPVTDYDEAEVARMTRWIQAFMQDNNSRLIHNRMSISTDSGNNG